MGWIFRKTLRNGPIKTTFSKHGMGVSWGISGFRIGVSPDGRKYFSMGIPGTGFYFIRYLSKSKTYLNTTNDRKKTEDSKKENEEWWKQKYFH